jgi:serpin B
MKAVRLMACSRWPVLLAFGSLILLSLGSAPPEQADRAIAPEAKAIIDGNSAFALGLFAHVERPDQNQILSPFSVSSALAMAYTGARGITEKQMAEALQFPTNRTDVSSGMTAILASFTNLSSGDVELNVANALWPQSGYQFIPEFLDLCRNHHQAVPDFVDFQANSEAARQRINAWAERSTKGKIKGLVAPGSVTADTRLVIANAIYFKGKWASRFEKSKTRSRPFWIAAEKAVQVPMMSQKSTFLHLVDGDTQILEMPYRGDGVSMLVLLPKTREGLGGLVARLNLGNLTNWMDHLRPAEVDLLLPRFKINSRFSLTPTLAAMGMRDAFAPDRADFSGMTAQRPLFINLVEHAALVEVDEEGTVAAAATGISLGCAQRPPPATFQADHPFVFLIFDRPSRTVLFMGKVTNPGA